MVNGWVSREPANTVCDKNLARGERQLDIAGRRQARPLYLDPTASFSMASKRQLLLIERSDRLKLDQADCVSTNRRGATGRSHCDDQIMSSHS